MKVKFGALIVEGRGKLAGWVLSRNRGGAYARQKVTPLNPSSIHSSVVRSRLSALSSGWRALTAGQRTAWNSAVTSFSKTDIFGDLKNPSGKNLYTGLNAVIISQGGAAITVPPIPTAVAGLSALSATADVSDDKIELTFTPATAADHSLMVYATPPLSAGVSFVKSEYRLIGALGVASVSPVELTTLYKARFGSIGLAGQKIFFKCKVGSTLTGQTGVDRVTSTIVVT